MAKEKSGSGSMGALQQGRKGEMGQVTAGGGSAGNGKVNDDGNSISSKWHERPVGKVMGDEFSTIVNKGDGLCK